MLVCLWPMVLTEPELKIMEVYILWKQRTVDVLRCAAHEKEQSQEQVWVQTTFNSSSQCFSWGSDQVHLIQYLLVHMRPSRKQSGAIRNEMRHERSHTCLSIKPIRFDFVRFLTWHIFPHALFQSVWFKTECFSQLNVGFWFWLRHENNSDDDNNVSPILLFQVFQGNFDNDTHRKNVIDPPIYARLIRILPWSWYGRITLRVEILGCTEEEWCPLLHLFFLASPAPPSFDILEYRAPVFQQ